jgi:hypothetical protein
MGWTLAARLPTGWRLSSRPISRVFGHLHSSAGIAHVNTPYKNMWAMNVGCLIDTAAYAFEYGKWGKFMPNLGAGIIAGAGRIPMWIPLE